MNFLLFVTTILASNILSVPTTFCNTDKTICISGGTSEGGQSIFTVASAAKGWVAIGIGSNRMSGSDMFVGWKNSTGGVTVGNGKSGGHTPPSLSSSGSVQVVPIVDSGIPGLQTAALKFSFCKSSSEVTPSQQYIWAFSNSVPSGNLDSASSASIAEHDTFGNFQVDFTAPLAPPTSSTGQNTTTSGGGSSSNGGDRSVVTGASTGSASPILKPTSSFTYQQMLDLHAVLMWLAWVISPMVGVFYARYLKSLGHIWFRIHMAMMGLVTAGLTIASLFLICLYRPPAHFNNIHAQLGLGLCIGMVAQVVLGILCNVYFDPARISIPIIDKFHAWIGRLLVLGALVNIQFGFNLSTFIGYPQSIYIPIVHYIIVALIVLLFLFAEYRIGPQSHSSSSHQQNAKSELPQNRNSWMPRLSHIGNVDEDFEKRMKDLESFTKQRS